MIAASESVSDLGLMGGMFDPVHNGHLNFAVSIIRLLQLDELALLPCGNPVHRENTMAPAKHRLAMLALAVQGCDGVTVDDRECRIEAPSYALNSLQAIKQEHSHARLYYLMGQDAFNNFHTWYGWRDIFSLVHIVIAARPGYSFTLDSHLQREYDDRKVGTVGELKAMTCGGIFVANTELTNLSSTMVREKLFRNEKIDYLVPEQVADYIYSNRLYIPETAS